MIRLLTISCGLAAALLACCAIPAAADTNCFNNSIYHCQPAVEQARQTRKARRHVRGYRKVASRRAARVAQHRRAARVAQQQRPTTPVVAQPAPAAMPAPEPGSPAARVADAFEEVAKAARSGTTAAIEAVETVLPTPFGTRIRTVAFRKDVPADIAQFLGRVSQACGQVRVISTFRRGARVAGSRRQSCHATGQAVDYQVANPACALRMAQGVRLGHSIDYHTAPSIRHFHVSNCRQEMGVRFAHGGGRSYARRGARTRYARGHRSARQAYARHRGSYRVARVAR